MTMIASIKDGGNRGPTILMYRTQPLGHWKENASPARHSLYPDLVSGHHETALGGPTGARRLVGRASRKPTACGLEFHPPDFFSPAWAKVKAGRAGLLAALVTYCVRSSGVDAGHT
jgi:hypothetical protein